jgi:tetratricopeptide (TPR) repeat protein
MYYKTLELNFEAYYAREQLVDLLIQLGRVEEAVDVLDEYIDIHPYDVYSRIKILKTYRKFEMFEQALSVADDILEINPRHYEALAWKGIILNRLGMKDETVKVFEEAIKYKKNYPFLSEYLGFIEPERKLYYDEYRYDVYDVLNKLNVNLSEYYQDDAVYLLNQEIRRVWENGTSSFTRHKVIYIQTEKGVEDFTSIPILYSPEYEDVTIHNAKVIQPSGEELVTMRVYEYSTSDEYTRLYYDEVAKFIEFEGLQVGSIIDLEYTIDQTEENLFADYFGEVFYTGNKETTLRSEYILIVPETRRFYFNDLDEIGNISREVLPKDGEIVYTFKVDNVDGVISEPNMPSIIELIDKIKVTTFKSWNELAQWYWGLIKDQFRVNYKIKDVVKELTLGNETEMEKVQSIYNYIVKEIRYVGLEFGIGGFKPREPIVCFNTKYGDCKDKGTLLITMLKEIGVEAKPVLIRTRSSGVIDMELPLLSNFNHYIVLANIDGEDVFLDPTAEFSGMNELPFSDQGVKVFVIDEGEGYFMETPVKGYEDNETSMDMRIWLSADGSAKATREVKYGDGDSAYQRSRFINKIKRKNIIEEYWSSIFPGTQVKDVDFKNIENYNENVSISYSLQIPELVRVSEDKYYLPTRIPEDDFLNQYASRSTRVYELEIGQPFSITSRIEYIIPEGFRVITDEFPLDIVYDSKFGEVVAKYEHKGDKLIADIDVTINVVRVSADDYIAFRHFLNEVDSREREEFILERVD